MKGIEAINLGLAEVNEVIQQNSSISEETAAASEDLLSQADFLQKMMNQFKLNHQTQPSNTKTRTEMTPQVSMLSHPKKSSDSELLYENRN